MIKKFLTLTAAFVFAAALSANAGQVVVGTNAEFPPFELTDDNNAIIGYDIDIITAVGKAAGFEVVMQNQAFDTLIESLESGKIDAVISGMTITDARREKIDFSNPYYNAAQVIVVQGGVDGYTRIGDIKGKKIGVQLGTTGAGMAEEVMGKDNPDLKQFRKYNEVFTDLRLGRIDAVVVDLPVANAYLRNIPGLKISSPPMSEEQYGIGVRKGNADLLKQINDGLAAIRANGEFDKITEKWFQN
ncbi:MAG: basic amino acid ABC transporter substrate-binding protein [Planctomycetota bacterium]|jgi:polar amino acid transport system substrate-binding protein|nr:basic amino acid ABC transporter substrate-binding protein [Planctomycetota bacterium]